MTKLENCLLVKTALFQESAWSITHSLDNGVIHGEKIHLTLDEEDFQVHLDKIEYTSQPCDWQDVLEDMVVIP